jgi:hypothetical protein
MTALSFLQEMTFMTNTIVNICLNPDMGDPDGYDVPITREGQGEPFLIGKWDIPSWCKLKDIIP